MWLLRNDQKGQIYRVTPGRHVVSRKDGDFLLAGDQSISRKHAQLSVTEENENEGITVEDLGSKYGTSTIIGEGDLMRLTPNQKVTLKNGDCVTFGIQWNCWRVEFIPLLVATSTLSQEEKTEVRQMVTMLGGRVISDWQDRCTHLTMNKLTVTVKVVCALASGQPIVTPAYWKCLTESLSSMQTTLPDCNSFVPPLAEPMLNPSEVSFTANPARSKLFVGFTFVAATAKQLGRIKPMIEAAGGTADVFFARTWTEDKLMEDKTILMQHSASDKQGSQMSQIPDGYIVVARKLRARGVRCIPESEIGLSVVYCSLAQYCNPHYSTQSLLGSSSLEATQPVAVICPETEESSNFQRVDLEPGLSDNATLKKRKRDNQNGDGNQPSKKAHEQRNSEDLFGTQPLNNTKTSSSDRISLSLKKTSPLSSVTNVAHKNIPVTNPGPSLDMFAPSGDKSISSNVPIQNEEIRPSCEDLFVSTRSGRPTEKNINNNDEFSFRKNKRSINLQDKTSNAENESSKTCQKAQKRSADDSDEFSFLPKKKINKPTGKGDNERDPFAFTSNTKPNKPQEISDEFSFSKSKKSNNVQEISDEFSFTTNKRPNKRNRQSNPDIFASSVESSDNNNVAIAGPSKVRKIEEDQGNFDFQEKRQNSFTFHNQPNKKRHNESVLDVGETGSEVKVALISKIDEAIPGCSGLQTQGESSKIEYPPEESNLITYGKHNLMKVQMKKEVEDEVLDELAKEFHNATVLVVKPLIVQREKLSDKTTSSSNSVKNFKKFRKVGGLNKRIVPHIIGGSDLVPHTNWCQQEDDMLQLPTSPGPLTPNDEWGFTKKKGNRL